MTRKLRRILTAWLILPALLLAGGLPPARGDAAAAGQAEWTVLFYLCGSDLESRYGYASSNLNDIAYANPVRPDENPAEQVNVLVETGGSLKWHGEVPAVDPNVLQRWSYHVGVKEPSVGLLDSFTLEQSLELADMTRPETLADFIRWGVQTYPAKKYALVLWGHGGGPKTGLLVDELYPGHYMNLAELNQALAAGGAHFETVLIDACLMASLETAWALKDHADWMVASQAEVPGTGTDVKHWLQELFDDPAMDGKLLGKHICDTTMTKYYTSDFNEARKLLTWSVTDLTRIERVVKAFDRFFQTVGETYQRDPFEMSVYAETLRGTEEYGSGNDNSKDLARVFSNRWIAGFLDSSLRHELLDSLSEAVVYEVRGSERYASKGLSYCIAVDFDAAELDAYAKNCPSPWYLAFLDAVSPDWTAPDSVYETAKRLPEMNTLDQYTLRVKKALDPEGIPILKSDENSYSVGYVYYRLYRMEEDTGRILKMGRVSTSITYDQEAFVFSPVRLGWWPAIEGVPCCMETILCDENGVTFNIPIQVGDKKQMLRCSQTYNMHYFDRFVAIYLGQEVDTGSTYTIYGVWDELLGDSIMANRNVRSLAQLAGQRYRLLYPADDGGNGQSEEMTMPRALDIAEAVLPAGEYLLEYEVQDILMRPTVLERIPLKWDGEKARFPDDLKWEGELVIEPGSSTW